MRAANRLLSTLLAVAIAVAGVLTVIEVIAATTGHDPVFVMWRGLVDDLATTRWKDAGPHLAAAVLIVIGLLLLLFAVRRGKPATVGLSSDAPDVELSTTRRSLQRSLATTATGVDGISDAKVKVKRRKVIVKAQAGSGVTRDDASPRLTSTIQQRLDALALSEVRRLKVRVSTTPDKGTSDAPGAVDDVSGTDYAPSSGSTGDTAPLPVTSGSPTGRSGSGSAGGRGSSSGRSGSGSGRPGSGTSTGSGSSSDRPGGSS